MDVTTATPLQMGRGLLKQVLRFGPGALVPALLGMVTASVFTRLLNPDDFGRYSLVLSITNVAVTVTTQWLQQGLGRYLPGQDETGTQELKEAAAVGLTGIAAGVGVSTGIALAVSLSLVGAQWQLAILSGGSLVLFTALFNTMSTIIQAEMQARKYTAYQVLNAVGRFVLPVCAVYMAHGGWEGLIWGSALATVCLIPTMWRRTGLPDWRACFRLSSKKIAHLKEIGNYGVPMIGWFLASALLSIGDRFIVQYFRGPGEVGLYSANYALVARGAGLLAAPLLLAAHPTLMALWKKGDSASAGRILGRLVTSFIVMSALVVGIFGIVAADVATVLLGYEFRSGYHVMPVVLAGELIWQLGMYTQKPLEFAGRTRTMVGLTCVAVVLNVVLNIILVPKYGYIAAAYTTVVSYSVYATVAAVIGQKIVPWTVPWRKVIIWVLVLAGLCTGIANLREILEGLLGFYWAAMAAGTALLISLAALGAWARHSLPRSF